LSDQCEYTAPNPTTTTIIIIIIIIMEQEYNRRLRMILKSELNARNKITAIGALAVPVLRYSFGIINWRLEEIEQIDRKRC
jgi:hypothetical protein